MTLVGMMTVSDRGLTRVGNTEGRTYALRYGVYGTYNSVKEMAESFRKRFDFYCWIVPIDS